MALISGLMPTPFILDKAGDDRGNSLLSYIAEDKLFVENAGDTPTFNNGRWTNSIDLIITSWIDGKWFLKTWTETAPIIISLLIKSHSIWIRQKQI